MKRYFGTTSSTIAGITSAVRTSTGITINETENISLWTRTDIAGFPVKYSGILYKDRAVPLIPGSSNSNTLITTDGLILLVEGTSITVADLFETGNISYASILPADYEHLINFVTNINYQNKRVFIITGRDENNNIKTKYEKVYINSDTTFFESDMDLDLDTDEYGYYSMPSIDFGQGSYKEVTDFYLIKRQFYLFSLPSNTSLYLFDGTSYVLQAKVTGTSSVFWFKDFNSDNSNKLLRFQLKNSETSLDSDFVTIY
jgi:hypothetical protein